VGKGDSLRGRLEHLVVAGSPFARSIEDKELKIIQNVLKVEPETTLLNLEKGAQLQRCFKGLGDKLRASGSVTLDIIIQQKLIAKTPYKIMHLLITRHTTLSFSMLVESMAEIPLLQGR
jgi:hypothetical protein